MIRLMFSKAGSCS